MTTHNFSVLLAAGFYLAATVMLARATLGSRPSARSAAVWLATAGVVLHAIAQGQHWLGTAPIEINFLNALSLCALVVAMMLLGSVLLRQPMFDAGLIALPIAAVVLVAELVWSAPGNLLAGDGGPLAVHVFSSVLAFGLLSIAGVYALFVAMIDYSMRHHRFNRLTRSLPALDVLEQLLFGLTLAGFVLLSVALVTGWMFVDDMLAQHLAHKTVLSVLAWVVFGTLLFGRWRYGWRGRIAVRLTLAGIVLLLLSYFGSKLVLEVLLDRSWQA